MKHQLHPFLEPHVEALEELIAWAAEVRPDPYELARAIDANPEWGDSYGWAIEVIKANRSSCVGGNAYAVPLLHPDVCLVLIDQAKKIGNWRKNDCEPDEYQIPEIVVKDHSVPLYGVLESFNRYLNIWHALIYQATPQHIKSIQFTRYSPDDTACGNWHHDIDSDYTAVISLDPSRFEGGGTDVRIDPVHTRRIEPLPPGYALLFNGKQLHHRGCAVTKGERYLLTYWLSS